MVDITADTSEGLLYIKFRCDDSADFQDMIENLKILKCRFDPKTKSWTRPIPFFDDLEKELLYYDGDVQVSELTRRQIAAYNQDKKELIVSKSRRRFKQELLKFAPLKGKEPFENYQIEDITKAINQNRFLFNWEMGLGKSYALAALIEHLKFNEGVKKALILSTPIGIHNLKNELAKFGTTIDLDRILVVGSLTLLKDRDVFNTEKHDVDIIIATYGGLRFISDFYYKREFPKKAGKVSYKKSPIPLMNWSDNQDIALFCDESHTISNMRSRMTEIVFQNKQFFKYRYLFTGTLADKYEKLYSQYTLLDPNITHNLKYMEWLSMYCELGNKFSKFAINQNSWNMEKLDALNKNVLQTYSSKRKMIECLNLPFNYEVPTIFVDMSDKQRSIYEEFVKKQFQARQEALLNNEKVGSLVNIFPIIQLAVDNPECIVNSASFASFSPETQRLIKSYTYKKDSTKLEAVEYIVQERTDENNERGILWYYHPATKEALQEAFAKYDPIVIEAGMDKEEMNLILDEFKKNPKHKLIIGSLNVMNTSVTLVECKYEVYVEKTYNYTVYTQARGRIWRPGQDSVTRTYSIRYKNSVDNIQELNLAQKGQLLNSLLNKEVVGQDVWKRLFNANENFSL